jgi:hypothetical protein
MMTDPDAIAGRRRPAEATHGPDAERSGPAIALGQGQTPMQPPSTADAHETARAQLRRILSKTETSRQTELVLLLERMSQ